MKDKNKTQKQFIKKTKLLQNQIEKLQESKSGGGKLEKKLREENRQLKFFMNSAMDVFMVYDKNLKMVNINRAGKKILGLSEKDIGKHLLKLAPHLKGTERYRRYRKIIKTGGSFSEDNIIPGGEYGSLHCNVKGFKVAEGFGIIMSDITQRKKAEEKIKKAAEEWQKTFDSMLDFVFIQDKDYRFVRVNKAFCDALKVKPKDLIGKKCYKVLHNSNKPIPRCPLVKVFKNRKPYTEEIYESNIGMWLLISASPLFDEKGEIVGAVHIARDVTERKKAEKVLKRAYKKVKESQQQLIQSEKLAVVGQLATGVAHEINNPLSVISGEVEMLLMNDKGDKETKDSSKIILEQAEKIKMITERLLGFSRKREVEKKTFSINNVLKKSLSLLSYQADVKDVKIGKTLDPNLPKSLGDKNQLQEVFLNIMLNAVQAMEKGGRLTVKTRLGEIPKYGRIETDIFKPGQKIAAIEFKDTGGGIKGEMLNRIFNPFFTTKEKSTGLGLFICSRIIKNHSGTITVQSKLGEGSVFTIRLPVRGGRK